MNAESAPSAPQIRVVICDDAPELRALLRETIAEQPGMEIVGEADNGSDGVRLVAALKPDVAVLDLVMPGKDGLTAIADIRGASPSTAVVVLSGLEASRLQAVSLARGAHSYVQKGAGLALLVAAIREAAAADRRPAPAWPASAAPRGVVWRTWLRRRRTRAVT